MWQDIQGHDAIVDQFSRSLAAGRLASAYLFAGPEGVGKRMFADALAKTLLCMRPAEAGLVPCEECQSCTLCNAGSHPDLYVVERRSGVKFLQIDQFIGDRDRRHREGFCHDLALRPLVHGRRIGIIDDADWLNQESANCLLKLLEEPPPAALIILVGTSRSRQLPTILSRVQVVRFHPLPIAAVRDLVLAKGLANDHAGAEAIAQRSGGSLTRAHEMADSRLWSLRDRFAAAWRGGALDPASLRTDFDDFVAAGGKEADARRQQFRQLLVQVVEVLREALRQACADDRSARLELAGLDRCLDAEEQLDRNANLATLLECWLDDLATA